MMWRTPLLLKVEEDQWRSSRGNEKRTDERVTSARTMRAVALPEVM